MQTPNENDCYNVEIIEEVARRGTSVVQITVAQCEDALYRYAISMHFSYFGSGGPIRKDYDGYKTLKEAKDAAMTEILEQFPNCRPYDPASVESELRDMKAQLKSRFAQPSLF